MTASQDRARSGSPGVDEYPEAATILIIDDDANLRRTLADIFSAKGYRTCFAANGADGLALLGDTPANVAIIDLRLPDIPGIELLHRIRGSYPETRTIILTGNATLETAIEATNRGAFCYMLKPYDIDELLVNVSRAIEEQQAEQRVMRQAEDLRVLFTVSSSISRMIEPSQLFPRILRAVTAMDYFAFERRGLLLLAEDDSLRLVSHLGIPNHLLEPCKMVALGECLCGMAAVTGEPLIAGNGPLDGNRFPSSCSLGSHFVILPLKTSRKVVGVLALYTRPGTTMNLHQKKLIAALGNQIGIAVENATIHARTMSKSLHDPLTGLANREFMQIQLDKYLELGKRYGHEFSLVMADIDWFKRYNDSWGHLEGDRLLMKVAAILTREFRDSDQVFRFGGEEFLVILPRTDLAAACEAAERVRVTVEQEAGVTISLGVAAFNSSMADLDQLMRLADSALYRAKEKGRNLVECCQLVGEDSPPASIPSHAHHFSDKGTSG